MTRTSRLLIAAAAVLVAAMLVTPLWTVHLVAPQYPEGLGMTIHINTVRGASEFDLMKINQLNHYIGMKRIETDAIPELRIMPWIVAALAVAGLAVAAVGRRRLAIVWLGAFALCGAAGLADFWRWEYDYGHDLDLEHAIIKVPGMTYQPPLIGSKQLLNFTASSWPGAGGIAAGLAFALGLAAVVVSRGRSQQAQQTTRARAATIAAVVPLIVLSVVTLRSVGAVAVKRAEAQAVEETGIHSGHGMHAAVERATTANVTTHAGPQALALEVTPNGPITSIGGAVRRAAPGAVITVRAGVYREPTIVVDRRLTIVGDSGAVLDGESERTILSITADSVTIRGLTLSRVGASNVDDRAAIKVSGAHGCTIEGNRVDDGFFGIYLAEVTGCRVAHNVLRASGTTEASSGNGIHLWSSREITIADNDVRGFRDGIYFEFVHDTEVLGNVSETNLRYGLHFMYSDDCVYTGNTFSRNGSGVAVMYTKHVTMTDNRFEGNRGAAAYGLLLKEISDPKLERNAFVDNTTALVADGANRIAAVGNVFLDNGWAVQLDGSTVDGRFTANDFVGNTFDVATNSRTPSSTFAGNYWDDYRGYDLNHDGVGDVPHHPVRLFSMIVRRHSPSLILLRSAFVDLLDASERALPALTPETLVDAAPAMRRNQ